MADVTEVDANAPSYVSRFIPPAVDLHQQFPTPSA
jgi:hypothetical protein